MARLTKASEALLETFGFVVETPPERDNTRRSKWDEVWEAAKQFCETNVGQTIRVRSYTNASMSYSDAKAINNREHRHFKDEVPLAWTAVAAKTDEVDDDDKPVYAIWLTYKPE